MMESLPFEQELHALARKALSSAGSLGSYGSSNYSEDSGIPTMPVIYPPRCNTPPHPGLSTLQHDAYHLARRITLSRGSMLSNQSRHLSSAGSIASSTFTDLSDVAPDYLRFQQEQERRVYSPYHAPAYTLEPENNVEHSTTSGSRSNTPSTTTIDPNQQNENQNEYTLRRPIQYGEEPSNTTEIDPRVLISSMGTYKESTSKLDNSNRDNNEPRYKHVEGGAFGSGLRDPSSLKNKNNIDDSPGPASYGDLSIRKLNGGTISNASVLTSLEIAIKRSQSLPSPFQYNTESLTRNGGKSVPKNTSKFSKAPARSNRNTLNRRKKSNSKSPYTSTPGPGFYETNQDQVRKIKGSSKFIGQPGDRFTMQGDALLNFVEQTYVDIQHEVTDDPIEWKLRTGHCWDVAERNTDLNGGSSLPINIGPGMYPSENDAAIGRNGRLQRAGKKSMPFTCFHRPNANKATNRRPLHEGIFERLSKITTDRLTKVNECNQALNRVMLKERKTKKMKKRRKRSSMTSRSSGNIKKMASSSSTGVVASSGYQTLSKRNVRNLGRYRGLPPSR